MIKNFVTKNTSDIEVIDLFALKNLNSEELEKVAAKHKIEDSNNYLKQDLIFEILQSQMDLGGIINCAGVLEILPDNFGFLRSPHFNYMPGPDDIYVSPSQIRKFNLKKGDTVEGQVRPPKEGERYYALIRIEKINYDLRKCLSGRISKTPAQLIMPPRSIWLCRISKIRSCFR